MKLVAAMHQPAEVNRAAEALAKAVGLTPAEAQFRLAAAPPSMLARLDDEAAAALIRELDPLGLGCVSCNFPVPDDQARTIARTVTFEPLALVCAPRAGKPLPLRYDELRLILRGLQVERTRSEIIQNAKAGAGMPVGPAPGGQVERRRKVEESTSHFLLVYDALGRCARLAEGQLSFACLPPPIEPSGMANIARIARELRARAPQALFDDRLLRMSRRTLLFAPTRQTGMVGARSTLESESFAQSVDLMAEVLFQAALAGRLQ